MPGMQKPFNKPVVVTVNGSGAGTAHFNQSNMGLFPYLLGLFNITAKGIGSGTFKVKGICPDQTARYLSATLFAAADIAAFPDLYILDGIDVEITGATASSSVTITLAAVGRDYRFETGT